MSKGHGHAVYNTLNDDEVEFVEGSKPQRSPKVKRRMVLQCVVGSFIVLTVVCAFVLLVFLIVTFVEDEENSSGGAGGEGCALKSPDRFNCLPEGVGENASELCKQRGCCWDSTSVPNCFYPAEFGYSVNSIAPTPLGFTATVERKSKQPSQFGGDIDTLRVDVMYETDTRVRVKIYDPTTVRYEVPMSSPKLKAKAKNPLYNVATSQTTETFSFDVSRSTTSTILFRTATGLIFSDQFLQLSSYLPSNNIYGLGEHVTGLRLSTNYSVLTLFSRDQPPSPENSGQNLYGVHPFYMCLEEDGNAHGVFLLNSNAMEVELQPAPSLTYRTIGGILDFYFFLGPSPDSVIQQYTECKGDMGEILNQEVLSILCSHISKHRKEFMSLIGRPFMPPYWSLGFHLCRWGYGTANDTLKVVERMREKGIPQDTQWNDIDYMHDHLDFTYDNDTFGNLLGLVADLHDHGQKYVVITDPGISADQPRGSYVPYDRGIELGVFVTDANGDPIVGRVWPGNTTFPDFTNPTTGTYWEEQLAAFHQRIGFDGLWIDMNEPSNFVPGSLQGCPNSTYNSPPFLPGVIRSLGNGIYQQTLCMTAQQNASSHYNIHSLYGHTEARATMNALTTLLNQRSLVISRSTYPGSGTHTGHWLGDNTSQWKHMLNSIAGILDFSLFGIPLVGADICGFFGNTTEQLCTRWQQLGAFYPFSRNHNSIDNKDQDPALWSETAVEAMREALLLRYKVLPFLYTLFHFANVNGSTVARPLFFEFPADSNTWGIDTQFMWGSALLISPVLTEDATTVEAYFPGGARWFELRNGSEVSQPGTTITLDAPLSTIPLHVRGGSILPMQEPNTTTNASRQNPFSLLVALNSNFSATGQLFLDDGVSLGTYKSGAYTLLTFQAMQGVLTSVVENSGYEGAVAAQLNMITIYGLRTEPSSVTVNNMTDSSFTWDLDNKVLSANVDITDLNLPFTVAWK